MLRYWLIVCKGETASSVVSSSNGALNSLRAQLMDSSSEAAKRYRRERISPQSRQSVDPSAIWAVWGTRECLRVVKSAVSVSFRRQATTFISPPPSRHNTLMYSQLSRLPARHATGHICLSCRRQLIAARRRQAFNYSTQTQDQSQDDGDDWFANFNNLSAESPSRNKFQAKAVKAEKRAAREASDGKSAKANAEESQSPSRSNDPETTGETGGEDDAEASKPSKSGESDPFEQLKADLHSKIKRPAGFTSLSRSTAEDRPRKSRSQKRAERRKTPRHPTELRQANEDAAKNDKDEEVDVSGAAGVAVDELLAAVGQHNRHAAATSKKSAQESKPEARHQTDGGTKPAQPAYRETLEAIIAEINADTQNAERDINKEKKASEDRFSKIVDDQERRARAREPHELNERAFSFASRLPHLAQSEEAVPGSGKAMANSVDPDHAMSSRPADEVEVTEGKTSTNRASDTTKTEPELEKVPYQSVDEIAVTEGKVSSDRASDIASTKPEPEKVPPPAWHTTRSTSSEFHSKPWSLKDDSDGRPTSLAARARMVRDRPKWGGVQNALSVGANTSQAKPGFDSLRQADKVSPPPKVPATAAAAKPWGMSFGSSDSAFAASPAELAEAEATRVPVKPTSKEKSGPDPAEPDAGSDKPATAPKSGFGGTFEGLKKMLFGSSGSDSSQQPAGDQSFNDAQKDASNAAIEDDNRDPPKFDSEMNKHEQPEAQEATESSKAPSQDSDEASQSLAKLLAERQGVGSQDCANTSKSASTGEATQAVDRDATSKSESSDTATVSNGSDETSAAATEDALETQEKKAGGRRRNLLTKHVSGRIIRKHSSGDWLDKAEQEAKDARAKSGSPPENERLWSLFDKTEQEPQEVEDVQASSEQPQEHKPLWEVMESMPLTEALKQPKSEHIETSAPADFLDNSHALSDDAASSYGEQVIDASSLEVTPLDIDGPPAPGLSYGLDRVLFNSGVHHLQDPHSRVHNFDPYLQKIMPVAEFDFNALKEYKTSSQDTLLSTLAREHDKKFIGSTSSMTSTLSQFHYLLSNWRDLNLNMLSRSFPESRATFTQINRAPTAIFLRWKNGTYAIDADKEYDSPNVLMMLGKSMEKLLTLPKDDYERYRKSDPREVSAEEREAPEAFQFTTMGDFLMRSQLDAYDSRLPGSGMFDLKTRACLPIRMSTTDFEPFLGYEIHSNQGEFESYEREYYDMMRSTMLKYMLQARMGRMDGIFLAYHNVERIFGFQYMPIAEIDRAIHGQMDPSLGDQEFKVSLEMLNQVLVQATKKFPERSLRLHFETKPGDPTAMYIFAEPMEEEAIESIQDRSKARVAEFEQSMMGIDKSDSGTKATESKSPKPQSGSSPNTQLSSSDSAADDSFLSSIDAATNSTSPLYAATLICAHRVNGEDVSCPTHLTSSDEWHVAYLLIEIGNPDEAWASYESTKARRKKVMAKVASTDDEGVAEAPETEGVDGGEGDEGKKEEKKYNTYYMNLLDMVKRGREFRRKMDEADRGREPVVYREGAGAGPEVNAPKVEEQSEEQRTAESVKMEEVRDVGSYMNWLYKMSG